LNDYTFVSLERVLYVNQMLTFRLYERI